MRPIDLAALDAAQRDYDHAIQAANEVATIISARARRSKERHERALDRARATFIRVATEAGEWTEAVEKASAGVQVALHRRAEDPLPSQSAAANDAVFDLHIRRPRFEAIRAQAHSIMLPETRAELHRFIRKVIEQGWNLVLETPEGVRGIPADQVIPWWTEHGQTVDPRSIAYVERPDGLPL
ncbi:hypothetical protein [Kocuria palustris]|uniref:hypothetical protein n=1 Tax=Kocuria palustris TaxID=71999 RepID=UPI0011AB0418|nr:hypothetical protein [Kocuria palustris]